MDCFFVYITNNAIHKVQPFVDKLLYIISMHKLDILAPFCHFPIFRPFFTQQPDSANFTSCKLSR